MSEPIYDSPASPFRATSAWVRQATRTQITILVTACRRSAVARLCASLERDGLARFPLAWRLPADRLDRALLGERIERYGDTVCPMGLTGAPNVRLHVSEIEAELAWATSNIWHTGVRDTFGFDPSLAVPCAPDGERRAGWDACRRSPVPTGLLVEAVDGGWLHIVAGDQADESLALPVLRPSRVSPQTRATRRSLTRDVRRRLRAAGLDASVGVPIVISLDVDEPDGEETAVATLAAVGEASTSLGWTITTFERHDMAKSARPRNERPEWFAGAPPLPPDICEEAAWLRRRRSSKINTRRLLELLAPEAPPEAPPDAPPDAPPVPRDPGSAASPGTARRTDAAASRPGHERVLVASMMGEATISGSNVSARFVGGRLCGLSGAVDPALPGEPTESLALFADGRVRAASVESCVSFESDSSRGLRSESVVTGNSLEPVARIRSDYSFVGDYDALVASHLCLVEGATVRDTLCAIALPIASHRRCVVTGRFADGSTYDHHVLWTETGALWAEAFQIRDGETRYTIVPVTGDGRPMPWSVSILREPSRRLVVGGRYRLGDRREHRISFLMMRAELDDRLVVRTLAGRVPRPIADEIAVGTVTGTMVAGR